MVSPAENRTTIRPYVQANGGMTNYLEGMQAKGTAELGARLNSGNLNAEVGAHIGTEAGAHAKVGYRLPLSDKVGINFEGGASYTKSLTKGTQQNYTIQHTCSATVPLSNTIEQDGNTYQIDRTYEISANDAPIFVNTKYKPDLYKAGVGASLDIKPNDKFNISFGAEAGVRGNFAPKVTAKGIEHTHEFNMNVEINQPEFQGNIQDNIVLQGKTPDVTLDYKKSELYVTPTISANYNINKNLAVGLQGNFNEASANVSWTF